MKLLFVALMGLTSIYAAPLELNTDIADVPSRRQEVCWYKGERVQDGGQVNTGEPCLNCMCKKGALVCDLQVCPHYQDSKLPPPGCFLVERKKACCPKLVCPDKESNRLDRQSKEQLAAWKLKHDIRQRLMKQLTKTVSDRSGCLVNGTTYGDGSAMMTSTTCEYCYCIRGEQRCMQPRCAPPMPGCTPRYRALSCCPSHYDCSAAIDALTGTDGLSARKGNKPSLAGVRGNDRIIDLLPKQNQNQPASGHVVKRQVSEAATSESMTESAFSDLLTTPDAIVEEKPEGEVETTEKEDPEKGAEESDDSGRKTSEASWFSKTESENSPSSTAASSTTPILPNTAIDEPFKPLEKLGEEPEENTSEETEERTNVEEAPESHHGVEVVEWNHPLSPAGAFDQFVPILMHPADDEEKEMLVEVKSVMRPGSVDGFPSQPEFIPGKLTPIGMPLPDVEQPDPEHIDYGSTEPPSLWGISIMKFVPSDAVTPVMPIVTAGGPEGNLPVSGFALEQNPLGTRGSALSKTSHSNEFLLPSRRPDSEDFGNFPSQPFKPMPFQGPPFQRLSSSPPPRVFGTPPPTPPISFPSTTSEPTTTSTTTKTPSPTSTTLSPLLAFTVTFPPRPSNGVTTTAKPLKPDSGNKLTPPKATVASPADMSADKVDTSSQLRIQGCNIYGHMYRVGGVIEKLSNPCIECICTEAGVECNSLPC